MAASPASVGTICCPVRRTIDGSSQRRCLQKLKSVWRLIVPTIVLFESQRTIAFPGRARGNRVGLGSSAVAVDQSPRGFSPSTLNRSDHTDDERSISSCCRQTVRNGYVLQFSFLGSNVSPFFQIVSATAAILRASVSRAISLRMPLASSP